MVDFEISDVSLPLRTLDFSGIAALSLAVGGALSARQVTPKLSAHARAEIKLVTRNGKLVFDTKFEDVDTPLEVSVVMDQGGGSYDAATLKNPTTTISGNTALTVDLGGIGAVTSTAVGFALSAKLETVGGNGTTDAGNTTLPGGAQPLMTIDTAQAEAAWLMNMPVTLGGEATTVRVEAGLPSAIM